MSGIAGVGSVGFDVPAFWVRDMVAAMVHRGPDDEGYLAIDWPEGGVAPLTGEDSRVAGQPIESYHEAAGFFLGHRRLSVLDPSPLGHQPMSSQNGKLWVVFNGEIYNYIELRTQLRQLGYTFHTGSDTEVLLAAYEEWGTRCLDYFDGMWSFVIFDRRKKIFFGARDPFGVKPFYYYKDSRHFAFASEIKGLITLPFISKQLNPGALFDFLVFGGLATEEEGVFKHIMELMPAHAFIYEPQTGNFQKWRYFALEYTEKTGRFNRSKSQEYIKDIRELVCNAVKLRLRSDVPVGTALSGGMDSSAIVCTIAKLMTLEGVRESQLTTAYRQKVFTASFPGSAVDENTWAQLAVESSGAHAYNTQPQPAEFLADLRDLAYTQDIPFGSPSVYAQYRVMKLARENGVKVLLDGQGADELFAGYTIYYDIFFAGLLKEWNFKTFVHEMGHLDNAPPGQKELLSMLYRQIRGQWIATGRQGNGHRNQNQHPQYKYIGRDFWNSYNERFRLIEGREAKNLNGMLFEFFTRQTLPHLLKYEDRNSMRFSVESRAPFADYLPLIRYLFALPAAYKIHDGWSKYLLRESMKGILPETIRLRRDKKGFVVPDLVWMQTLKKELAEYIGADLNGYIQVPLVLADLEKGMVGTSPEAVRTIWSIISFAVWKKVFRI